MVSFLWCSKLACVCRFLLNVKGSLQSRQAAMNTLGVILTSLVVFTAIIPLCVAGGGGESAGPGASGCPEPTFLTYLVSKYVILHSLELVRVTQALYL